jgi:hypothetical protein
VPEITPTYTHTIADTVAVLFKRSVSTKTFLFVTPNSYLCTSFCREGCGRYVRQVPGPSIYYAIVFLIFISRTFSSLSYIKDAIVVIDELCFGKLMN